MNDTVTTNDVLGRMAIALVIAGIVGLFFMPIMIGVFSPEPHRSVTIKVAADSATAEDISSDKIEKFENLNEYEKRAFLGAVEEADTSFEESSIRFESSLDANMFNGTQGVEYSGVVYPVFVVEDRKVTPMVDRNIILILWFVVAVLFTLAEGASAMAKR